jgi:phage FluMu gp28-like protein
MAAIIPALHVEIGEKKLSSYFLPWQTAWIHDDSRLRLAEKSVRIGWTFGDAFKNVRKRLLHKNRDYLFCSKDQASAAEYMRVCEQHAEIFNFTKSILTRGEETETLQGTLPNGDKFTQEVRFCYMKFDNGSRIMAFSSNPYAMAVFGGDVGIDEYAKHPQAELLYETAQGRIRMGYDMGIWSAHNGTDTMFYQFAQEARAGKGGWAHYKVTMEDAVEGGLVEAINRWRGTTFTREQYIADCKNDARLPEIYEQAYNCNPQGSTSAIVPWAQLANCQKDYQIARVHLEAAQVTELFGDFKPESQLAREHRIALFIESAFAKLFNTSAMHRLGFDVAASGEGDLACIYIDVKESQRLKLAGLFTCRTDDWNFLQTVLWTFHRRLSALQACGDETGLGRQICWATAKQFSGIFTGVNFSSEKHDMGFALMNQLSVAEKLMPKDQPDIAADYFAMRKIYQGKRWVFTQARNLLNPASHGDIAWGGALSTKADGTASEIGAWVA